MTAAGGVYCDEAAVELLIGHRSWLYRDGFIDTLVGIDRALGPLAVANIAKAMFDLATP